LTACTRHGKTYLRKWVKPSDPKTQLQVYRRGKFAEAMAAWKALPRDEKKRYNEMARKKRMNGTNLFVKEFMQGEKPR
jgi:hypothetical protein